MFLFDDLLLVLEEGEGFLLLGCQQSGHVLNLLLQGFVGVEYCGQFMLLRSRLIRQFFYSANISAGLCGTLRSKFNS